MEDHQELARILVGRLCNALKRRDTLASGPNLKGKFFVASGYLTLDKQSYGQVSVPWWK